MKLIIIEFTCLLFALFYPETIRAQMITFEKNYGGSGAEGAYSVKMTSDNGYILAGFTDSFGAGRKDIYVIKTNAIGDTLWTKTYGGSQDDIGQDILEIPGEGYLICGSSASAAHNNIIKIDYSGDVIWSNSIPGSYYQIAAVADQPDAYVLCGEFARRLSFTKINSQGDTLWLRRYGPEFYSVYKGTAYTVMQTSDRGFIVAGGIDDFSGWDMVTWQFIVKVDSLGVKEDSCVVQGKAKIRSIAQTPDDNFIGGGEGYRVLNTSCFEICKFDYSLSCLWRKEWSQMDVYHVCLAATACYDNTYVFAGTKYQGAIDNEAYLVKTDANGNTLWTRSYSSFMMINSLHQTNDHGLVMAGDTDLNWLYGDIHLMKTDSLGQIGPQTIKSNAFPDNKFELRQNYPNPFNPSTTIEFEVKQVCQVTARIFNIEGQLISTLVDNSLIPGSYKTEFYAGNLSSGIYFYQVKMGDYVAAKKMILSR